MLVHELANGGNLPLHWRFVERFLTYWLWEYNCIYFLFVMGFIQHESEILH